MQIKAFIFDLDGVITSSSNEHFLAWSALAKQLGYTLHDEVFDKVKGISRMQSLNIVLQDIGLANRYTIQEKQILAQKKNKIYVDMISQFGPSNLMPGTTELLTLLKQNDIKIILGSASCNSVMLIRNMKIIDYFDYIVNPVGLNSKPSPDIFNKAADYFHIDHKWCVGIEDAPAGIQAIKSAGMFAVGIGKKELLPCADIIYHQLKDMDIFYINNQINY